MALPPGVRTIEVNGTAFRVHKRGADVRVLSPVDGEVVEAGAPGAGWYLKVRPAAAGEPAFRHLLRGAEVRPWLMREMERLQLTLYRRRRGAGTGRRRSPRRGHRRQAIPEADWDAVCGEMFLEG